MTCLCNPCSFSHAQMNLIPRSIRVCSFVKVLNYYQICASVCVCMYLCACELGFMQKPEAPSPQKLDLQAVLKYLTYVVGTELRCFAKSVHIHSSRAISLASVFLHCYCYHWLTYGLLLANNYPQQWLSKLALKSLWNQSLKTYLSKIFKWLNLLTLSY